MDGLTPPASDCLTDGWLSVYRREGGIATGQSATKIGVGNWSNGA